MPEYASIVDEALLWSRREAGPGAEKEAIVKRAIDRLAVEFGLRILAIVPGRVSTEVDARLSFDTKATVDKAHAIIKQYEAGGATRARAAHQDRPDVGGDSGGGDPREGGSTATSRSSSVMCIRPSPARRRRPRLPPPFVGRI